MYNMTYRHCIAEGIPYELGYELGKQLVNDMGLIKDITPPLLGVALSRKQVENTASLFEKYIPGINEEIKGFSDAVNVSYLDMVIYSSYLDIHGGCSHFWILQNDDHQRQVYHARNYDADFSESPILITARAKGKHHSTGFGCKIFGRFDGMNDKGLCVTTSSVDIKHTGIIGNGFIFPMVVRAILDQCSSVYEAKEMFMEMPYAEYRNFLLSDKTGSAILIEASPEKKSYQCINAEDRCRFLCSANHFILNQCNDIKPVKHSIIRQQRMEEVLSREMNISFDDMKALLSECYPEGLAFPYYQDGMGTLWSIIYDPLSKSQYVCYGSPESETWTLIDQNGKFGCRDMMVPLANINGPQDLWE